MRSPWEIAFILACLASSAWKKVDATGNFTMDACISPMLVNWWQIGPYIFMKDPSEPEPRGIFVRIVKDLVTACCGPGVQFEFSSSPATDSEALKAQIGANKSVLAFPIYGKMTSIKSSNKPYFPVVESPGVIYIQGAEKAGNAAGAVMSAVLQGWPVLVLTLIMAALSGIVMWALDSYWNPEHFPSSFFKGSWEGFWWAFVSMTTVGYGDRAPKSFIARIFAFFWVLVGLVIISIFTATVTTSLTALSLSNDIDLYGSTVVALRNTEEYTYGVTNNAKVVVVDTVQEFADSIVKKDPENAVAGGLIDSYVAGYEQDKLSEAKGLRVGTVFDHQYAYGFVVANELDEPEFVRCLRRTLSTKESEITQIIQSQMKPLPEPEKSAAEEKSSNLFDPRSQIFQNAVFTCLGLIAFLSICGIAWDYLYWRPKQKKKNETKKDSERMMTPHTSFEELVAAQCQEVEDAMISEVMAFYKAFNSKLEEVRKRHLQETGPKAQNDERKVNVMSVFNSDKTPKIK